ncbi:MAG: hypothetical protein HYX84_08445 [Chloroflexi bacterium]|nr:hypothetical protein [Chloroflexota bacterium]
MVREDGMEREFSEYLDSILRGEDVTIGDEASGELREAIDFARRLAALQSPPSDAFKEDLRRRLMDKLAEQERRASEAGEGRRFWGMRSWLQIVTTAAVVVLAAVGLFWYVNEFTGAPASIPVPSPTPTPAAPRPPAPTPAPAAPAPTPTPTPTPAPAPAPPFETKVIPQEASYLPGESVDITLSFTNTSSESIIIAQWPPEIRVTPRLDFDRALLSVAGGTQPMEVAPNGTVSIDFSWDQKDGEGNQVPPGWYNILFRDISVRQGDSTYGFNPGARVLIQYPQGAMEKIIEPAQSQTMNGILITLQRLELTASGITVHAFNTPPGYSFPAGQPMPGPSMMFHAEAEYSVDGGVFKRAGSSGIRPLEDGMLHIWDNLDPVPSDAKELVFRITRLGDWEGPWEFRIPLE